MGLVRKETLFEGTASIGTKVNWLEVSKIRGIAGKDKQNKCIQRYGQGPFIVTALELAADSRYFLICFIGKDGSRAKIHPSFLVAVN